MISNIVNVNVLVSLLKQYNINHIVMAPGASDIPVVHVIEKDNFFTCYSVVDERSLVYFALGISQRLDKPVACVCTSGTAVSNFLPGMTEAYYQDVPLVAITCDKNPNYQGQIETQKIQQVGVFGESCKKCVNLPVVKDEEELWLCERLVNEALIALTHHGRGPVQINIPIVGDICSYKDEELPKCKKIEFIEDSSSELFFKYTREYLKRFDKIMLVVGQNINFSPELINTLEKFVKHYKAMIAIDHQANLQCCGAVNTYPITELEKELSKELLPTLVVSMGNNVASYDLKYILRRAENIEHWQIDEAGRIRDVFQHLTAVFECTPLEFFNAVPYDKMVVNDYLQAWEIEKKKIEIGIPEYSSFYVMEELSKVIPENSILHLAILNSTRLMQYFNLKKGVRTYSNFGALGIDGCLSTFMGQASVTEKLAFCVIGDLSFFYDMNSAGICHRSNNIRIILLNNKGAGEFYFTIGKQKIDTIDKHIAAVNDRTAKGWIESLGYEYYAVHNKQEVSNVFKKLEGYSDKPIFVEVFIDIKLDTDVTREYYNHYRKKTATATLKEKLKEVIGDSSYNSLKKAYYKIKQS